MKFLFALLAAAAAVSAQPQAPPAGAAEGLPGASKAGAEAAPIGDAKPEVKKEEVKKEEEKKEPTTTEEKKPEGAAGEIDPLACNACKMIMPHILNFESASVDQLCSLASDDMLDMCRIFAKSEGSDFTVDLQTKADMAPNPCVKLGLCAAEEGEDKLQTGKGEATEMDLLIADMGNHMFDVDEAEAAAANWMMDPDNLESAGDHI